MSEFRINRKSWHYKIARFFAQSWDPDPKTFCQYWRNFILSSLFLLVLGGMGLLLLTALAMVIYLEPVTSGITVAIIVGVIAAIILMVAGGFKVNEVHERAMTAENPSVFQMKYRTFKQKICPPIKYE